MALISVTPPAAEPIDLAEAKVHLRYIDTAQDALVAAAIAAVRGQVEGLTRKQLVAARWKQVLDAFPYNGNPFEFGRSYSRPANAIYLERGPLLQVVSIQYLDMAGVLQTVDPSIYTIDSASDPVRITPVFGQIWPIPMPQIGAVSVTFDAGFAAPITANGNNVTVRGWLPLNIGDVVRFTNSGGALPAPLQPNVDYFVQSVVGPGIYTFSATAGGAAIALTNAGTGTSFLGAVPEGIKSWMKLRLGTFDVARDEPSLEPVIGGVQDFTDRLLDGFTTFEF